MALVWFFGLRPPSVASVTSHPEHYRALVASLAEQAESEDADYVFFSKGPMGRPIRGPLGDEISERMEALGVACVLYIHRAWGRDWNPEQGPTQRGIVVAGDVPRLFGGAKVRAYKLVDGRLERWPGSERPRGPTISNWRNPYEGDWCTTSG